MHVAFCVTWKAVAVAASCTISSASNPGRSSTLGCCRPEEDERSALRRQPVRKPLVRRGWLSWVWEGKHLVAFESHFFSLLLVLCSHLRCCSHTFVHPTRIIFLSKTIGCKKKVRQKSTLSRW